MMELDDTVYIELARTEQPLDLGNPSAFSFGFEPQKREPQGPTMETYGPSTGGQDVTSFGRSGRPTGGSRVAEQGDRVAALTSETAGLLQKAITAVASQLKPDLESLGASKATVKLGAKLAVKSGKLAALIAEAGGEGTVEITVEFTAG
jgi:hypothetical protein